MNRSQFAFALILFLLPCCVTLTENEDKGFNDALNFYNGYCKYSVGMGASTKDEELSGRFFELELSKSEALKVYKDRPEMVTSNMAYRFYRHLNKDERGAYDFIRGALLYDNGKKVQHDYAVSELEMVEKKMHIVENVVNIIKAKEFQRLSELVNSEGVFHFEEQVLIDGVTQYDSIFGNVTGLEIFGFKFSEADNAPVLSIFAMIMRDIQNNELRVYLNPKSDKNQILMMDYKW